MLFCSETGPLLLTKECRVRIYSKSEGKNPPYIHVPNVQTTKDSWFMLHALIRNVCNTNQMFYVASQTKIQRRTCRPPKTVGLCYMR
jgi:hypothetical protein